MTTLTEADVESAALDWLATIGWQTAHGPDIAPDTPGTERADYAQAVLETRQQDALARLNPFLPATALGAALRKLTNPEGATLEARNRAFHRMIVNGVSVEYRAGDGNIRGEQAQVVTVAARTETTGWRSASSPSLKGETPDAPTSYCSSMAFPWVSSN